MIPKVIHYCWFGGNPLPYEVNKCLSSWKKFCPDYKIIRWDESNFDVRSHPFASAAYDAGAWAFVSDYARLKVVYDYGGIYLDTDVELLKNIDFLIMETCYVGIQQSSNLCNTGLGFGAEKLSPVVRAMLDVYDKLEFDSSALQKLACPALNTQVLSMMGYSYEDNPVQLNGVKVFPSRFFDPIAPGSNSKNLMCADSVSIHHYSNSWGTHWDVFRRKLIGMIGVERIAHLKEMLHE